MRAIAPVVICSALLTLLPLAAYPAEKERFPGVQRLMSEEEFQRSGLDTLSPEQLKVLNQWLLRYTAGDAQRLQDNPEVREAEAEFEVVSRLVGEFKGWSGNTIFTLENGQRWQQRLNSNHIYLGPPNPEVRISRNRLGFFKLTILPDGRSVGVKPLP